MIIKSCLKKKKSQLIYTLLLRQVNLVYCCPQYKNNEVIFVHKGSPLIIPRQKCIQAQAHQSCTLQKRNIVISNAYHLLFNCGGKNPAISGY